MLKSYITVQPYTKFVLIEDSLEQKGRRIFDFLLKNHLNRAHNRVHFFVFHGSFFRIRSGLGNNNNVVVHDFVSANSEKDFESIVSLLGTSDIVVIDSLVHVMCRCGLAETYQILNSLKNHSGVQQIISLLHTDLLEDKEKVTKLFEHLSTLHLNVEPKFGSEHGRLSYTYKKSGGKVVRQIEEYSFEGDNLITKKIEKPDLKKLLENSMPLQVNPETLSTFKIGLSDKEKQSRDQLVLPYLPKDETEQKQEGGTVSYKFDEVDDWDEEDPDDDLDI